MGVKAIQEVLEPAATKELIIGVDNMIMLSIAISLRRLADNAATTTADIGYIERAVRELANR